LQAIDKLARAQLTDGENADFSFTESEEATVFTKHLAIIL